MHSLTGNSIQEGVRWLTGLASHAPVEGSHSKLVVSGEQHVTEDRLGTVHQFGDILIRSSVLAALQ